MRKLTPIESYILERRLQMLAREDFFGREVLEVGIFKGDHLKLVSQKGAKGLFGVADSEEDYQSALQDLEGIDVSLGKIKGKQLPFPRQCFHSVFTVTFLQHITDKKRFEKLLDEACRASDNQLILIEHTEGKKTEGNGFVARTLKEYTKLAKRNDFKLIRVEYLNAEVSLKFSNFLVRTFGENNRPSETSNRFQKLSLPITKMLDSFSPSERNLTKMVFEREKDEFY